MWAAAKRVRSYDSLVPRRRCLRTVRTSAAWTALSKATLGWTVHQSSRIDREPPFVFTGQPAHTTMADQILDQIRDVVEGQIDFEGQKLVELIVNVALTVVGAVAFLVGYFLQDIKLAVWIGLGGTALTFVAVVPPWPFYNQHPVKWLPIGGGAQAQPINLVIGEKTSG
ncbi:microsomal signal peptidase 12 kDa subunit-domain-containing protein [Echria macrotheca]|uniref:Signal peptidase complex subunit 1 n=1 Tax=Echria macrotheca TaxID=438768 RepID=A0AAJ0B564_9PEZI|nr:microsomal signal peptidase 12 kDa subunit-domain-containing protein [Echria macrotheca]